MKVIWTNEALQYTKLIYKITEKEVFIMKVFDCRRNPKIIKNM